MQDLITEAEELRAKELKDWKVKRIADLLKQKTWADQEIERISNAKVGEHSFR